MSWLFFAVLSPLAYGAANVLDNYLTSKLFKDTLTLTAYSVLFNSVFVFLIFFVEVPGFPPLSLLPALGLIGLIEVLYLYPYYKALQSDDTSIVAALFILGKTSVPILAFLLVGEALQWQHYAGFFIIILASTVLTLNGSGGKFRFNASFGYMLACSVLLAIESVVYKHVFDQVSWSTGFFWTTMATLVIISSFFLVPRARKKIIAGRKIFKKHLGVFTLEEFFSFIGGATFTYAVALAPITVVEGIAGIKPMFVLLYALAFARFFPNVFHEHTKPKNLFKKFLLFALMAIGVVLVTS